MRCAGRVHPVGRRVQMWWRVQSSESERGLNNMIGDPFLPVACTENTPGLKTMQDTPGHLLIVSGC
jgi:hypothetical protein